MKTIAFTILLSFFTILGFAQDTKGITITITIDNIKNDSGHILLGLHTTETFMKADAIQQAKSEIIDGKIITKFENVHPGTFAILALHDENDNGRMDFQDNGMPKETYGMSNNAESYRFPQFADAKFVVADKDLEMDINLM